MSPDADFNHARVCLSTGRTYHYIDQRPRQGDHALTLLCIHGFPDLWYGWRHQIHPWVAEGCRVVAPDMLGYGKTDMPEAASAYSTKRLCDDLAALLDHLGVQKAVVIGHDWGSFIASRFALWHPQRLLALILLSLPYTPPAKHHVSVQELAQRYPPFDYQVYFASKESAAKIEADLPSFFRLVFKMPKKWAKSPDSGTASSDGCLLSDEEFQYYISNFRRGMIGPLSYYRTTRIRFEEEKDASLPLKLRDDLPVLMLYGTDDKTCPPTALQSMDKLIDRLQVVPIPDVGHWIMLEAPQRVTETILQWLKSAVGVGTTARL